MGLVSSSLRRLKKPNAYLVLTGAAAASAMVLAQGSERAEGHSGHGTTFLPGVNDGGKMYDDIAAGQCSAADWVCYMTMSTSIVTSAIFAVPSQWHDEIRGAIQNWNGTDTTLYFAEVADDIENDLRFAMADIEPQYGAGRTAVTELYNFHKASCGGLADCEDADGNPAHQPERWWYASVLLDDNAFGTYVNPTGLLGHEMGHGVGLAHQPTIYSGYDFSCPNPGDGTQFRTIMDYDCLDAGAVQPKAVDVCGVNHASDPLMYGNDPNRDWNRCS